MSALIQSKFSDEYIEYWGNIYTENPLIRCRGILFFAFLQSPEMLLHSVLENTPSIASFLPLLEKQLVVQKRQYDQECDDEQLQRDLQLSPRKKAILERQYVIDVELESTEFCYRVKQRNRHLGKHPMRCSNGRQIEPLSHRSHYRNKSSKFVPSTTHGR